VNAAALLPRACFGFVRASTAFQPDLVDVILTSCVGGPVRHVPAALAKRWESVTLLVITVVMIFCCRARPWIRLFPAWQNWSAANYPPMAGK